MLVSAQVQIASGGGTVNVGARLGNYVGGVPQAGYTAEIESNGNINLWRVDNFTLLGSYTLSGFSLGTWYTLGLRANGSTLSVEINGSTVIGPVTDSAFAGGDAGLWSYSPSAAGSHRFDNFSVTTLGGGGALPKAPGLARPVAQSGLTPAPNQVFRLYYYAGSLRAAVRVLTGASGANDLYFLHADHLGSTSLTTNMSQAIVGQQRYFAYGEPRNGAGTLHTDRRFTGQREETGLGSLYDYNARYYSPLIGRFISADSIVPGAGNPQALNRYAYALSNPLRYIDPTGHASRPSCASIPDCGLNDEPPQAPLPDQRCRDYGPCYDAYLTYQALVEQLGRLPTLSEVLYMTAATEYWSYVDKDRIPAGQPSVRVAGREGLARSYYASCRVSNCSGSNLYRFLSGYEPWSGQVARGDGDPSARAAKLATAGKDNFYGTGAELRKDVGLILNQREARSRGWTAGRSDNAPWQWFGPYETTLPVPGGFGLDSSNYAILAVDLGSYTDKEGVIHHQYFFIFTGSQTDKFQESK